MSIKAENVSYVYNPDSPFAGNALQEINLEIKDHEILGITGTAGAGKSTLLQMFNGLLRPGQGRILVDGQDVAGLNKKQRVLLRYKVGLVFQTPEEQIFEKRVYDEIAFGPRNLGMTVQEVEKTVFEAMRAVGLIPDEFFHRDTATLSSGEKRRVAIASFLAMKPQYLLLDEPTAGLDYEGKTQLYNQIRLLNSVCGTTVVIISHHLTDLMTYCHRLILMEKGKILFQGSSGEWINHYQMLREKGIELPVFQQLIMELNNKGWEISTAIKDAGELSREIARICNCTSGDSIHRGNEEGLNV